MTSESEMKCHLHRGCCPQSGLGPWLTFLTFGFRPATIWFVDAVKMFWCIFCGGAVQWLGCLGIEFDRDAGMFVEGQFSSLHRIVSEGQESCCWSREFDRPQAWRACGWSSLPEPGSSYNPQMTDRDCFKMQVLWPYYLLLWYTAVGRSKNHQIWRLPERIRSDPGCQSPQCATAKTTGSYMGKSWYPFVHHDVLRFPGFHSAFPLEWFLKNSGLKP